MVGPEVASTVAAEALITITKEDPGLRLAASTAILLEEPPCTEMPSPSVLQPDRFLAWNPMIHLLVLPFTPFLIYSFFNRFAYTYLYSTKPSPVV